MFEVPTGWRREPLANLGAFLKGRGGPRADDQPTGVPVVRYGELYTQHNDIIRNFYSFISPESATSYSRLRVGDVLFAGSGETADEIGKAAVFLGPEPAYAAGDTIIFRPDGRLDPLFLGYASNGPEANAHKMSTGQGSSVMHIYARDLEELSLSIPPLSEQRKIGAILSSMDDVIGATQKAIEQTKRVKQGLLSSLMTRGIGHTRFKKTEIGEVPEAWEVVRLRELLSGEGLQNGVSPPNANRPSEVPTFSISAMREGTVTVTEDDVKYADVHPSEVERFRLSTGDVLLIRGNANPSLVGTAAIARRFPDGAIFPDILIRVRLNDRVRPRFFVEMWNSPTVRRQISGRAQTTSGTLKINQQQVSEVALPLPAMGEQEAILAVANAFDRACATETPATLVALKQGLMHDLLTGRVRVRPD